MCDKVVNKVFHVYILQSESTGRYYCGHTGDLERRIRQHNDPGYRSNATTRRFVGSWTLIWSEEHSTRGSAMRKEHQIKNRGIGRFLEDNS